MSGVGNSLPRPCAEEIRAGIVVSQVVGVGENGGDGTDEGECCCFAEHGYQYRFTK